MEVKTISEEELDRLKIVESFFARANNILGSLVAEFEMKKSDILRQMSEENETRETLKKELSDKYGNVSINLETGEISES